MAEEQEAAGREVRIALVLNGGVSLAIWMGGVAHEIDLLRRASRVAALPDDRRAQAIQDTVPGYDRPVFTAWVDLCRQAGIGSVVVDVISGTSAGGLNGTLLATAIGRGVPLDPAPGGSCPRLREIWDSSARLEPKHLIREDNGKSPTSVLDGDFFRTQIGQVIGGIGTSGGPVEPEPMTLFVTATALGPGDRPYLDSFGGRFDVADHRRLYRFRHLDTGFLVYRPDAAEDPAGWWREAPDHGAPVDPAFVDDFSVRDATAGEALATAARASASFPVAFDPIQEGKPLARRRIRPAVSVDDLGTRWLVDGGILDNAPFEPVLDAITRRQTTEAVRRLLVYVVPSRGAAGNGLDKAAPVASAGRSADGQPAWRAILGAAVDFPREADVRDDIEFAAALLSQSEVVQAVPQVGPEALFRAETEQPTGGAEGLFDQFRRARAIGGLQDVRAILARAREGTGLVLAPVRGTRLAQLVDQTLPWVPPPGALVETPESDAPWSWGLGTAERVCRLMARDLRSRRTAAHLVAPVESALRRVEAVRDAVDDRLTADCALASDDDADLVRWTAERFEALHVERALTYCVHAAAHGYSTARAGEVSAAEAIRAGLVVEVATQAFTAYHPFRRTSPFEFLRLGPDVESPFVDVQGRTAEQAGQAIDEARRRGDRKLHGTRVSHFAAFGLSAWRAWDWTAGRLDAQVHLSRALVRPDPAGDEQAQGAPDLVAWTSAVQEATVAAELRLSPAQWASRRQQLYGTSDSQLVADLFAQPGGEDVAYGVVDAAMSALPNELALGRPGLIVNAVLARKPRNRFAVWWAPVARIPVRRQWRRWTERFTGQSAGSRGRGT